MIMFIVIMFFYFVILWLSKCSQIGWLLGAFLFVIFFAGFISKGGKFAKLTGILKICPWIGLIVFLVIFTMISQPPVKRVPAVSVKNPVETGVISVSEGDISGVYNEDQTVEVYAGIPYAKPPVGELRWKETQPAESWDGVLKCDEFGPMSMQSRSGTIYNSLVDLVIYKRLNFGFDDNYIEEMSEDSLYLNVWKPAGDVSGLPVVFFVHGGSLMTGQSSYGDYNGETFAKEGVIFVNFAYRLNIFGYMAEEGLAAESANGTTGNYGLLDQIQALKWVKENISAFGGDPNNITIAGESAGSSSVNALCVSPLTEGLFRRAIAESSGITAKKPYHTFRDLTDALSMGKDIMFEFGVSDVTELRNLSAEELLNTSYSNSAMTVDGYAITEQPYLTYEKGNNHEEALLNGYNANEAEVFNYFVGKITPDNLSERLQTVLGDYTDEAIDLYKPKTNADAKAAFNSILSAAWFEYSHHTWSDYMADQEKPVYLYYFSKENSGLSNKHAGEMPYAYGNIDTSQLAFDESDKELSDIMVTYWINFAKTGDPNGEGVPEWIDYKENRDQLIEFNNEIQMINNPFNKMNEFLDSYQNGL
ncbi:MAG: carboxylesterase family protein [Butyrivibrio sp.]|nr:carboxylesterase family protein [Butyrivibrio sp.]